MLSEKMLNWLQEQEEDDVDGYLDVDLYIKEWAKELKEMEMKMAFLEAIAERAGEIMRVEEYNADG